MTRIHILIAPPALGDQILTSAPARALKTAFPNDKVAVQAKFGKSFFLRNPYVDTILESELPEDNPFLVKHNLHGYLHREFAQSQNYMQNPLHLTGLLCSHASVQDDNYGPEWFLPDAHKIRAVEKRDDVLEADGKDSFRPTIVIQNKTSTPFKDWKEENWHTLSYLLRNEANMVQLVPPGDVPMQTKYVTKIDKPSFTDTALYLAIADATVSLDSFTSHAAKAVGQKNAHMLIGARHPDEISYADFETYFDPLGAMEGTAQLKDGHVYHKLPLHIYNREGVQVDANEYLKKYGFTDVLGMHNIRPEEVAEKILKTLQ